MLEKLIQIIYECSEVAKITSLFSWIIIIYILIGMVFSVIRGYQKDDLSLGSFAIGFAFYVFLPVIVPIVIIYCILVKEDCDKCNYAIWRWQSSVRKEEPFICSDGNNYPIIQNWHKKCYKKNVRKIHSNK